VVSDLVADALVRRLVDWGIHRIFGYSGDGIDPILGAIRRAGGDPEFVGARHEENAAFMACGHAKWTGGVGCCIATHGPGAIHLLNGLYDAKLDKRPVVALVAQQHRTALGSAYQQEIDLHTLFKDVCSAYLQMVTVPEQLHLVVDRAVRTAITTRSPTAVTIPHDTQQLEMPPELPHRHAVVGSGVGLHPPRVIASDAGLDEAAAILNAGKRVAILVGQGAARAGAEVVEVADVLGAGVAKALLGKAVLSDDLPFVTGAVGHLGTTASHELMTGCDTLLMIGTNEPFTEFLPQPGRARGVQIDIDGRNLGHRYPTEANLVGDAAETLRALLPRLRRQEDRSWRERIEAAVAQWWSTLERRARAAAEPLNPQLLFHELSPRLPDDAWLAVDVGSVTYWYARHIRLRGTMAAHLSSTLASMGSALPYAVAGKLARPDGLVVGLVGDGAMLMNGINELVTVAHRWRTWADPRLPILVLSNGDLNEVTWEMREVEGDPRFAASQDVPSFPYAGYAELLGLGGIRLDRPEDVGSAWERALAADRPVVIEAVVDPAVPLLAPHLTDQQAEQMAAGLNQEGGAAERARRLLAAERSDPGQS
jgi:pyruvate dehydrogenase (quinone)